MLIIHICTILDVQLVTLRARKYKPHFTITQKDTDLSEKWFLYNVIVYPCIKLAPPTGIRKRDSSAFVRHRRPDQCFAVNVARQLPWRPTDGTTCDRFVIRSLRPPRRTAGFVARQQTLGTDDAVAGTVFWDAAVWTVCWTSSHDGHFGEVWGGHQFWNYELKNQEQPTLQIVTWTKNYDSFESRASLDVKLSI